MSAVAESAVAGRRRSRSGSDFATLGAPIFELVLKLRAETVVPSPELRPLVKTLLQETEQRAATLRYSEGQIRDVKFALAAFVDETVMTTGGAVREEWERFPLQLEYFGEQLAGVKFFERLDELIKSMKTQVEVVEIYYLCLLLGFKGKYKVYMEDKLQDLIKSVAAQLKRAGRLQDTDLSPHWQALDQPKPRIDPSLPLWFKVGAGAIFIFIAFIYLVLLVITKSEVRTATEQLLR